MNSHIMIIFFRYDFAKPKSVWSVLFHDIKRKHEPYTAHLNVLTNYVQQKDILTHTIDEYNVIQVINMHSV